jgi:hypothetical protein
MNPRTTIAVAATLLLGALAARTSAELPKAQPLARYQGMMERSPFAVATVVATPPPAPTFAKELFVANAAKIDDKDVVTLNSTTDKNFREYLTTGAVSERGYKLVDVQWSDRVGETKVMIEKDGNTATLSFNQALISAPTAAGAAPGVMPQMQQPGQSSMVQPANQFTPPAQQQQQQVYSGAKMDNGTQAVVQPAVPQAAGVPPLPTPPPRTRAVIQRNPGVQQQQVQPQNVTPDIPETE